MARLTHDFVINLAERPQPMYGRDTWRAGAETMRRAFPDITADIHDVVAAEDRVAVRLTLRATTRATSWASRPPAAASST